MELEQLLEKVIAELADMKFTQFKHEALARFDEIIKQEQTALNARTQEYADLAFIRVVFELHGELIPFKVQAAYIEHKLFPRLARAFSKANPKSKAVKIAVEFHNCQNVTLLTNSVKKADWQFVT